MENKELSNLKSNRTEERIGFKLPEIDGDQPIWLGQSIIALIGLNQSLAYSDSMNRGFIEDLFVGLINHFNLDYKTLYEKHIKTNVLDSNFDYTLNVRVDYDIVSKTEY